MTTELLELPGSRRPTPEDMTSLGRVPGDEQITVSVYLALLWQIKGTILNLR